MQKSREIDFSQIQVIFTEYCPQVTVEKREINSLHFTAVWSVEMRTFFRQINVFPLNQHFSLKPTFSVKSTFFRQINFLTKELISRKSFHIPFSYRSS